MTTLLDYFFGIKKNSATIARDRLTLVLAHERAANSYPFIDDLKRDLLEVIKKYTQVKDIKVKSDKNQDIDLLEFEILLDATK